MSSQTLSISRSHSGTEKSFGSKNSKENSIQSADIGKNSQRRGVYLKRHVFDGKELSQKHGARRTSASQAKEPKIYPKVISNIEFSNILNHSRQLSKDEKDRAYEEIQAEKDRLMKESKARIDRIRRMDLKRSKATAGHLNEIEEESRQRTMQLLERAENMKMEQEEEIKQLNKIILDTKCRAIRDAQLQEKRILQRNYLEEELRINKQLEEDRLKFIEEQKRKEKERLTKQEEFSRALKEQLLGHEEERLHEIERKREESRLINLNNIAQQEIEIEKLKERENESEKIRNDLFECNERLKHFKAMAEEEDRIMDLRVQQFNRELEERKAKNEAAMKQEFLRREKEKERVAAQCGQNRELEEQILELSMARIQEEVEREWRNKEKEEALKRKQNISKLRKDRERQIQNKMISQAVELEREKVEFERILRMQKEAKFREENEREKRKEQSLIHRRDILKQVNEKEREKIVSRQKLFEEGRAMLAEEELRKKRLQEAIDRKYKEVCENKVPEMYVKEIKNFIENMKEKQ